MALFRVLRGFLARFGAFRVGLCCLRALRGLCGFCTRVELGGFMACCVFAFLLSSLLLLFFFFAFRFPCLSSGCPVLVILPILSICFVFVGLWVCCWVFFFPCGLYAKERAQRFVPCVLSSCVVGCSCFLSPFGYSATFGIMKLL